MLSVNTCINKLACSILLSTKEAVDDTVLEQLRQVVNREPLAVIFDQEKELVWEQRFVFLIFCHL